jgi:hypothetical protein
LLGGLQQSCFEHVPNSRPVVRRLHRHAADRRPILVDFEIPLRARCPGIPPNGT